VTVTIGMPRLRGCMTPTRVASMSKLRLSVAVGHYDRVRPLMDGAVQIDGVDPVFMNLPPEEGKSSSVPSATWISTSANCRCRASR